MVSRRLTWREKTEAMLEVARQNQLYHEKRAEIARQEIDALEKLLQAYRNLPENEKQWLLVPMVSV